MIESQSPTRSDGSIGAARPRILFLDQTGQLGGAELFLLDVAQHFRASGEVALFQEGPFVERLKGAGVAVDVRQLGRRAAGMEKGSGLLQALLSVPDLLRLVAWIVEKARRADLLYANTAKALVVGSLAALIARKPLIFHLHDIISADHFSRFNRQLIVAAANRAVCVIANSEATKQSFLQAGGRAKTEVVYNGFRVDTFQDVTGRDRLRKKVGVAPNAVVAGVFGRLTPWKGQRVLLEAAAQIPELHVMVVGDALFTEEDRAYAAELKAFVEAHGLSERVHFLGFRDDVPDLLQACDIVVHCSTAAEPFGRVIVEGMLARRPVVATRAGGALEILKDRETGLLVAPGDVEKLKEALRRLLADESLRTRLGSAALAEASQRFGLDQVLAQIAGIVTACRS